MVEQTTANQAEQQGEDEDAEFENLANAKGRGFLGEFVEFLVDNKKWWLIPIVVALLGIGILVLVGGTAAAPFIYTLF